MGRRALGRTLLAAHLLLGALAAGGRARAESGATVPAPPGQNAAALAIAGHAVSVDGKPVPGVRVTVTAGERGPWPASSTWSAATGADGRFRIEVPAPEGPIVGANPFAAAGLRVSVEAARDLGLAPVAVRSTFATGPWPDLADSSPELAILLAAATGRITGTVLTEGGGPLAGAVVRIALADRAVDVAYEAKTDAAGRYAIAGLGYGHYSVTGVEPPAGTPWIPLLPFRFAGVRAVPVAEGATQQEDFHLAKGGRIIGRVLDEAGKPLAGAAVSCGLDAASDTGSRAYPRGAGYAASAATDAKGAYTLGGLRSETYRLSIQPPPASDLAEAAVRGVNVPGNYDVTVQDVALATGGSLVVRVRQADGRPAVGATVACSSGATARTDSEGRAVLAGLATGRYGLAVQTPGKEPSAATTVEDVAVVAGLATEQDISLAEPSPGPRPPAVTPPRAGMPPAETGPARGAVVTGRVTDPKGEAVPGCRVLLVQGGRGSVSTYGGAETGPDGRYAMAASRAAAYQVVVGPPAGRNLLAAETPPRPIKADQTTTVDVTLKAGSVIMGKVAAGGKPSPWTAVSLRTKDSSRGVAWILNSTGQPPGTWTGLDGRFRFDGLAPGKYDLAVAPLDPQYCAAPLELSVAAAGEQTADLALRRAGHLAGRLRDASGKGLGPDLVSVRLQSQDGGRSLSASLDPDGRMKVAFVPPGRYSLTVYVMPAGVQAGLGKPAPVDVVIEEGRTAQADLEVPAAGPPAGEPPKGAGQKPGTGGQPTGKG